MRDSFDVEIFLAYRKLKIHKFFILKSYFYVYGIDERQKMINIVDIMYDVI